MENLSINGCAVESTYSPLWWHERGLSYTATGYGAKIPTAYTVKYNGKTRRVYCTVYSNSGTCWVIINGQKIIVR